MWNYVFSFLKGKLHEMASSDAALSTQISFQTEIKGQKGLVYRKYSLEGLKFYGRWMKCLKSEGGGMNYFTFLYEIECKREDQGLRIKKQRV